MADTQRAADLTNDYTRTFGNADPDDHLREATKLAAKARATREVFGDDVAEIREARSEQLLLGQLHGLIAIGMFLSEAREVP